MCVVYHGLVLYCVCCVPWTGNCIVCVVYHGLVLYIVCCVPWTGIVLCVVYQVLYRLKSRLKCMHLVCVSSQLLVSVLFIAVPTNTEYSNFSQFFLITCDVTCRYVFTCDILFV